MAHHDRRMQRTQTSLPRLDLHQCTRGGCRQRARRQILRRLVRHPKAEVEGHPVSMDSYGQTLHVSECCNSPMHLRRPPPNGRKAKLCVVSLGTLLLRSKRVGRNSLGRSQFSGDRCRFHTLMKMSAPFSTCRTEKATVHRCE